MFIQFGRVTLDVVRKMRARMTQSSVCVKFYHNPNVTGLPDDDGKPGEGGDDLICRFICVLW